MTTFLRPIIHSPVPLPRPHHLGLAIGIGSEHVIHECPFVGQASGIFAVGLIVFEVLFAVANIPIAPDDHVGILNFRIGNYLVEGVEEFVFFILLFTAGSANG